MQNLSLFARNCCFQSSRRNSILQHLQTWQSQMSHQQQPKRGWTWILKIVQVLPMVMLCFPFRPLLQNRSHYQHPQRTVLQKLAEKAYRLQTVFQKPTEKAYQMTRQHRRQVEKAHQKLAEKAYRLKTGRRMQVVQAYRTLGQVDS